MNTDPKKPLDVVGVGSWTNFDHLFTVDKLPAPGDTVQITGAVDRIEQVFFGGCAPNNAAAAAKLGAKTALISVVGADFESRGYQAYLEELGVDLSGTLTVEDDLCGHSFLYSNPDGKAICLSHLGAAAKQEQYSPDETILSQAKVAVINYRFDAFTLYAAQVARDAGSIVILSGAVMTAPNYAAAFVSAADILICTDHELQQVVEFLHLSSRMDLFKRGVRCIIATRGQAGSQIITADKVIDIPIAPAAKVVDPVGAGDGFVGGFAAGLAFGYALDDAARLGAVIASFVVEAWGCQTNLPTFAQAMARYEASFQRLPPNPAFQNNRV